ncbi:HET-domain-containing protein [Lepidopterella palustris CBS 459.81]|uniref:HET-domain-containing protein n=1 Tax=Lepidopterella palustris CBS 459.81 TaxID=1314670 RepID=A0A8E2DYG4_9PEZI|nr:HET-domain-containing protein [Lepidopterella palustris CBS 459.81]
MRLSQLINRLGLKSSTNRPTDRAAKQPADMSFPANTETNNNCISSSKDATKADQYSTETPRNLTTNEESSNLPLIRLKSSTAEIKVDTRLRRQLWIDAYARLERRDARLVDAFERVLSHRFYGQARRSTAFSSPENHMKNMGIKEKEMFLKHIIQITFKGSGIKSSNEEHSDDSKENLEFVKRLSISIMIAGEEVPFAWVGVCLGLKFLLGPVPPGFDREAVVFLISKMNLFWDMPTLLREENRTISITEDDRDSLKERLLELYTTLLSWQMKTVSAYYRQQKKPFLRNHFSVFHRKEIEDDLDKKAEHIWWRPSTTWEINYYFSQLINAANADEIKFRDMHLGDVPTICTACGNLDPRIWQGESYATYVMDVQHASSECPACMVMARGFSEMVKPLDTSAELHLSVPKDSSLKAHYHWGTLYESYNRTLEFYIEQGHPRPWPALRVGRSLHSFLDSGSMELISLWFNRCLREDRICRSRESALPTRVLCVGDETCEPYLYETRREEAPYIALSHCWGDIQNIHLTTTTANLKDRMASIPMATLPKTFSDAMLVTRELGMKYLWIDSLCIIQNDAEDWARESARMSEVYQNATLTISADGAANSSEGLFETIKKRFSEEIPIPFQNLTDSGTIYVRETTLGPSYYYVHAIDHKENDPLRCRAWALQEWLLSDRIVHFARGELLWECKTLQLCQCQVVSQPLTSWGSRGLLATSKQYYIKKSGGDRSGRYLYWKGVVQHFTRRQLTVQTDRLPALSGLAALSKRDAAQDYVVGLWKSELPEALLWEVDREEEESERFEDYYAPSWSWASVNGSIYFPHMNGANELPFKCKVLEIFTAPATSNPFGHVKSGFIKVEGPVGILSHNMKRTSTTLRIEDTREETRCWGAIVLDVRGLVFEVTSVDEIPILIIARVTTNGEHLAGIALKRLRDKGEFMRVGYFWIIYCGGNWESWILNELKVKKQIITIV